MLQVFLNGDVVLPHRLVRDGMVLAQDGKILSAGPRQAVPDGAEALDAAGGYILPGLVDIHLHGGGGCDCMDGTAQAMRSVAQAHCAHGVTAMAPTTLACSEEELEQALAIFREVRREGTGGADFLGLHLEGPYFAPSQKGAQPERFLAQPTPEGTARILRMGDGDIVRWDAAPELRGMESFARQLCQAGVMVSAAHTDATAQETERAFDWGFSHMTHFFCAMSQRRKREGRVVAGAVEAALLRDDITLEVIADGRHVPRESLLLAYKVKGPDSMCLITDAMRAAGTDAKTSWLGRPGEGTPVIVEDNVAKLCDRSFYAGSVASGDRMLRVAHLEYGVPLWDAVRMATLTPARLLRADRRKGSLEAGKDADVIFTDRELRTQAVWVRGEKRA